MREYTVREYDMEDYDIASDSMTLNDIVNFLEYIERGYLPDYNFTGKEDDFEYYKLHMAIDKAIKIIKTKQTEEGVK